MNIFSRRQFSRRIIYGLVVLLLFGLWILPAMALDRFVDHADGTVTDNRTGLMWATKDNGSPINWPSALYYCQKLTAGGHTDWRLPTIAELRSLYDPEAVNSGGYHMTKLIDTTAQSCWASETRGNQAARFNFTHGDVYWLRQFYSGPTRVLPVRDVK
jgi:hypothetical protein